uniref:Uncharacterized protein n=1 Tax=Anguilla anguilla TaxID=7936 RepID=A0A0E9TFH6_ANGAN
MSIISQGSEGRSTEFVNSFLVVEKRSACSVRGRPFAFTGWADKVQGD